MAEENETENREEIPEPSSLGGDGSQRVSVGRDALGNVFVTGNHNNVRVTLIVDDQRLVGRLRLPAVTAGENPYRGLDSFYETDSAFFFGRSKLVRRAWILFQKLQRGSGPRILAVVGASGSGKSSLVRAGLLPELAREPVADMRSPNVLVLRPGLEPLDRIADVLGRFRKDPAVAASDLKSTNAAGQFDTLHRFLRALHDNDSARFVLVIDQFEELFTECSSADARLAFLENLAFASANPDRLVSVILTLRSDFIGALKAPEMFASAIRERRLTVQAMDRDDLIVAISQPAQNAGHPWPPALVENLVGQAEGRPGALPLLQFALKQLWSEHVADRLNETFWSSRLIEDFLVQAADTLFDSTGDTSSRAANQLVIRRAFIRMVQLGDGTPDTRRVARLSELVSNEDDSDRVRNILAPFTAAEVRLVTASERADEPTYEVVHDALITSWDRLAAWLGNVPDKAEAECLRTDLRLHRRLSLAAADWKHRRGDLWRPPALEMLSSYLNRAKAELTVEESEFARTSIAAWEREVSQKRRSARLITALAAVLAVAFGITFGLLHRTRVANANAVRQAAIAEATNRFIEKALQSSDPNFGGNQEMRVTDAMANALKELDAGAFKDQPEIEAKLRTTISFILNGNARSSDALLEAEKSLEILKGIHLGDDPTIADALQTKAVCLFALGRSADALVNAEAALDMYRRVIKGDDRRIVAGLTLIGGCFTSLGRGKDALQKYDAALDMRQRMVKGDDATMANCLNAKGLCLESLGRSDEALWMVEAALQMRRNLFKGDSSNVAESLCNVGYCLNSMGRSAEALPKFEEALVMLQRLFNGDHPTVAKALNNVGECLVQMGRYEEALPKLETSLEMRQRLFKGDNPNIATALNNVAECLSSLNRNEEALPKHEAALKMFRSLFKGDHPDVASTEDNLAACLASMGRFPEALPLRKDALEMRKRLFKGDHPDVASSLNNVAGCLESMGRAADALSQYEAALAMLQRLFKGDNKYVAACLNNTASCLYSLNRVPEALSRAQDAANMADRVLPEGHPIRKACHETLNRCSSELRNTTRLRSERAPTGRCIRVLRRSSGVSLSPGLRLHPLRCTCQGNDLRPHRSQHGKM